MPPATRARSKAAVQPALSSSDDEAPEELSLATGKVTAEGQQKQEQQAQAAVKQTARAARQQRELRRAEAAVEAKRGAAERRGDVSADAAHQRNAEGAAEDGAGDEPVEDRLPDAVVEALAERERARAIAGSKQRTDAAEAAEAHGRLAARERRKRRRMTERRDGPITFRLLGADPVGLQQSESAKQFLREQLLGEGRVRRSADMLRPTRIHGGRSGAFYYGPPLS